MHAHDHLKHPDPVVPLFHLKMLTLARRKSSPASLHTEIGREVLSTKYEFAFPNFFLIDATRKSAARDKHPGNPWIGTT
jgi:hypothetical protein